MPFDLSQLVSLKNSNGEAGGLHALRRKHRSQASRIALRATIGFVAVAGINMLAAGEAWAGCIIAANVVCDGGTGPDTLTSITGSQSVTYVNGETNSSNKGLAVTGGVNPDVNVAIDATSSITASDATGAAAGAALKLSTTTGNISTTMPTVSGINGNLTSTVGPGLNAVSTGGGNINIVQGATSTITGTTSGININTGGGAGNIDLIANGTVTGKSGIVATTNGTGNLAVTTGGNVTATAGTSIDARHLGGGVSNSGVTVTTAAGKTITANGGSGIIATLKLLGSGGITVNNASNIAVSGVFGIDAIRNDNSTGDVKITNSGNIGSGPGGAGTLNVGIRGATNPGANGNVIIVNSGNIGSAGDVLTGNAINAIVGGLAATGNIDIKTSNASLFAAGNAISAQMTGKGNITITGTGTGSITSTAGLGINAFIPIASPGNITIDVAQDVSGKTGGIAASTAGNGNISVTAQNVAANNGTAINAQAFNPILGSGAITVTTLPGGVISAKGGNGINAVNNLIGLGGITILNDAAIKVSGGTAIAVARGGPSQGDILVTSNGAISSGVGGPGTLVNGIFAVQNPGAQGKITINLNAGIGSAGDVATGSGIFVTNSVAGNLGSINVNVNNANIFATTGGIIAQQIGKGNLTIIGTGTGTISAADGFGINASVLNPNPGNITVDVAQNVIGKIGGISATTLGNGNISVTAGNVTTVGGTGIEAITTGLGSVTIAGSGNVTSGAGGTGIEATIDNAANASDVVVNRTGGTVTGDKGIVASTNGLGNVSVTASSVTANAGNAIDAQANGFGVSDGGVTVTTLAGGVISANAGTGILVQNSLKGSGGITVLSDAAIKVSGGNGIFAIRNQGTGDIKITSNGAIGSGVGGAGTLNTGILAALNPGANGNILVNVGGDIGSTTDVATGQGIAATNGGSANLGNIDINVTKASIFASGAGINAQQFGKGNLTITGTGAGTISSANNVGISAIINNANAGNITVNVAQDVVGKTGGINAVTPGDGNISVTAGNVTAKAGIGINATNTNAGANAATISVTTAAGKLITATGGDGIVTNSGVSTGLTTIAANAGITTDKTGITATSAGGGVTIAQGAGSTITAGVDAIKVNNTVGGAINVNAAGTLVAKNGSGVFVNTTAASADPITVTTNIVKSTGGAGTWGSQVRASAGTGDIVINSNGAMGSATGNSTIFGGILAVTSAAANRNVTINVNADIGSATDLSSAAQVQINGSSTSAKTLAVNINNASIFGGPGAIKVTQGATSFGDIKIVGTGTGTLSATKAGAIGINANILNAANAGNIIVDVTQDVVGVVQGISTTTVGGGNISVTAGGNVTATAGNGIFAANNNVAANSGKITVTQAAGKVLTATANGIETNSGLSNGATTVNVNGTILATGATGVKGTSTLGDITVNVAATGKIDPLIGVDLATISGALAVNNAGFIDGDNIGVQLVSTGVGPSGNLIVAQTGTGTINGTAAQGVLLRSVDATQFVTGNKGSTTISGGTLGIDAQTTGTGGISITDNTVIGKTGGILATATGLTGGIFVGGEGNITTAAGTAVDLLINNAASTGNITYNRIGNVVGEHGIKAVIAAGTGNIVLNVTGNVTATNGIGISAAQNDVAAATGIVSVQTASGSTISAANGNGIDARNNTAGADVTQVISNAAMKVSNGFGIAAVRNNGGGDVVVISNGAIGSGSAGAGTLTGGIVAGANAPSNGNVSVAVNASIGGAADVASGQGVLAVTNGTGNVVVQLNNANVWATGSGIDAQTSKGGSVTVLGTGTGTISSAGGTGISATSFGAGAGQVAVQVTQNVVGKTAGISAITAGSGNVIVNAFGNVSATGGTGISAINNNAAANAGKINVFVDSGKTVTGTGGNGIETNSGISTGATTIGINGNVTSTDKSAVVATSNGGAVTITQAAASTITAGVDAIKVNNGVAGGAITINAAGTVIANNGSGVFVNSASATADPITVTTNIIKSTGGAGTWGSQVRASAGSGDITINSNGAIGSAGAPSSIFGGILATTSGTSNRNITVNVNADIGTATDRSTTTANVAQVQVTGNSTSAKTLAVNLNNASIFATAGGIRVDQNAAGLGDIQIIGTGTGTISANGAAAFGITARNLNAANNGNVTVDVTQNVIGVTQGINASTVGGGNLSVTARGNVTTTAGSAMLATNANTAANAGTILVQVASGKLVSATGGNGITTNSGLSTGATTIVVAGEVKASGAGFAGIKGTSTNGAINVLVAATGKVDPEIGIDLATVNGALLVNNAGLVQGDITAIKMAATGTGTGTVLNSGTITGGTNAVLGTLVNTPFVITNGGTMNGAVNVTGSTIATSVFTNGGIWNSGAAPSNFSGSLANSGITNIGAGGTVTIQGTTNNSNRINFVGAGSFTSNGAMTNTGIINAANNITGNQVIVNAAYVGGGQFFADYNSGTITADTLRITGAASGNTNVALNRLGLGFVPTGFIPVVTVLPGGAASLFTSNTALPSTGFLLESFGKNPANASQWGIIQTINPVVGDLGGVSTLANSASAVLNDPASAFVTQKANPSAGETQFGLWMRGGAGDTKEDLTTTLSSGAFSNSFNSRLRMSHQALQLGFDYGILNMGGKAWNLHFGVTGGKLDAGAKRRGSPTNIQFDATFAGGYVFVTNGELTLDASVRKEWREFTVASAGLLTAGTQEVEGDATVASILASYRIGGGTGFQITPQVGYSYGDSDIDPFVIDAFTRFTPGGDKTKLGHAGVKIGYRGETGDLRFEPFVSVTALRNWSNREDASVLFAGASTTNFDIDTFAFRKAIRYSVGLQGSDRSGKISAFIVGNLTDGNRVEGASVSVGARVNF